MKLWQKIDFVKDGKRIKKYKLCGRIILCKEKTPMKKKWILGLKICKKVANVRTLEMQKHCIIKSKYFDSIYYMKNNPDVVEAKIDPIEHYLMQGWKEGRNPS